MWYPKKSSLELIGFSDVDYASSKTDRKSISGTCQFFGHMFVSWSSKKQNSVAFSTVEAEYIAAGSCCAQILRIKQQLGDFGVLCIIFLSFVITQVPLTLPKIMFNTHAPSILRLGIILLEIMHLKVTFALNLLTFITNLLTFLPNP